MRKVDEGTAANHTAIRILEARLDGMKPAQAVNAKIRKAAEVLALLGWNRDAAQAALELLWPFALALLGELGTIVFLSYGMVREKLPVPAKPVEPAGFQSSSVEPTGVTAWVAEFRARHQRNPRLDEVRAEFPGIAKTTAWRKATGTTSRPKLKVMN